LSDVIEDLAGMGYRTTWGIFSASEVGAPHQRKRVFILAVSSGFRGTSGLSGPFPRDEGQPGEPDDGSGEVMANAGSQRPQRHWGERGHGEGGSEIQTGWSRCSAWPSRPGEQQYGWEPPRVVSSECQVVRDADGTPNRLDYAQLCVSCDNRTDELRLLGNGVVPATAHRAFCTLIKELDDEEAGR
jgi:DNA (cytosine-5)-methyltransferase 1